jgi:hypothetical protein
LTIHDFEAAGIGPGRARGPNEECQCLKKIVNRRPEDYMAAADIHPASAGGTNEECKCSDCCVCRRVVPGSKSFRHHPAFEIPRKTENPFVSYKLFDDSARLSSLSPFGKSRFLKCESNLPIDDVVQLRHEKDEAVRQVILLERQVLDLKNSRGEALDQLQTLQDSYAELKFSFDEQKRIATDYEQRLRDSETSLRASRW